jgi:acetyl-CoA C-acetyltransferase
MESMSNSPYLMKKHRAGARIGHDTVYDHMMLDGLEDAYEEGRAMGTFAEDTAREYQFTREQQDEYAIESLRRAKRGDRQAAPSTARPRPVTVKTRKGEDVVDLRRAARQGQPGEDPRPEARLRQGRHHHRRQRSSISDGAAALVLTRRASPTAQGREAGRPHRRHAAHAQAPAEFTIAPIGAVHKALEKAGWSVGDVDLFEVNEAFACVAMIAMRDLGIAREDQRPRRRHRARPPDRRQRAPASSPPCSAR